MLLLKDLVSGRGRWKENYGLFPKFGHSIYGDCPLREAIKKDYEILDIVKNSETSPPPGWYGQKNLGRSDLV